MVQDNIREGILSRRSITSQNLKMKSRKNVGLYGIQRPLEDLRLEAGTVCDGNGLSRQQRVAWTREPVVDDVSCLCLAMLV